MHLSLLSGRYSFQANAARSKKTAHVTERLQNFLLFQLTDKTDVSVACLSFHLVMDQAAADGKRDFYSSLKSSQDLFNRESLESQRVVEVIVLTCAADDVFQPISQIGC
ncbi:hypothetical protein ASG42_11225 [Rhizobium sp. Leaf391]|nr:hypothetical protein ASG42_11225 [Rhizobium sp. Leaf391]